MRILGEIHHPTLKITVFHMNDRYSIKFENGIYEQTYKLREDDRFNRLDAIKKLVDSDYLEAVQNIFKQMHSNQIRSISKQTDNLNNNLPLII